MSLWYDVTHTHTHSGDLVLFSANIKWSAHALHILPLNWPLRLCVCGCVRDAERCRGIKYNYRDVCIWVAPPSLSLQNLHTYLICFLTAPFSPLFLHLPLCVHLASKHSRGSKWEWTANTVYTMAYSVRTQTYTAWHCKIWSGAEKWENKWEEKMVDNWQSRTEEAKVLKEEC